MILDIHSHIIPNVDDGSHDFEESLDMIKESVASGVTDIIATPHHCKGRYEVSVETIKDRFNKLVEAVKSNNIQVNLYLGQEIYISRFESPFEMLDNGKFLTMNGQKVILIEFSMTHKPEDFEDIIYNFSIRGYKVIVAHVERYEWMTIDEIQYLKSEGAYIQVNSDSLVGKGKTFHEKHMAKKVFKKGLIDFIASDMHSFRRSHLALALKKFDKAHKLNDPSIFGL